MILEVGKHKIKIKKELINEKEINVTKCQFVFDEDITDEFAKEAYFTQNGTSYKQIIVNNECDIPYEVLTKKGEIEIGVVAFLVENGEEITRYNPTPVYITTLMGSLKDDAENSEPITPTDKEQIEQQLLNITSQMNNLDVDAEKENKVTTITITKKDGTAKEVQVLDGEKGDKGEKGDAGAIKMLIVAELPETGAEDTIYLVPLESPESQENNYAEYVYINGNWELLGKIGIQVDLTDYVKNTDYATSNKGGVIKSYANYNFEVNSLNGLPYASVNNYDAYVNRSNNAFISKGTLENVIAGKELVNKTYVDTLIGDISAVLDAINGEVV